MIFGAEQRIDLSGIRTNDLRINMPALYQLSYLALSAKLQVLKGIGHYW